MVNLEFFFQRFMKCTTEILIQCCIDLHALNINNKFGKS
jgi:hypothetical protein